MNRDIPLSLELMLTGLDLLFNAKIRKNLIENKDDPFRSLVVYGIVRIEQKLWVPFNRNYDVLGLRKGCRSKYESFLYTGLNIEEKDINFELLWDNDIGPDPSSHFYLFSDQSAPWLYYKASYLKNAMRYKDILYNSFFGKKCDLTFEKAWSYKKKSGYREDYEMNLLSKKGILE